MLLLQRESGGQVDAASRAGDRGGGSSGRGEDALGEVLSGGRLAAGRAGRRFRGGGDREEGAGARRDSFGVISPCQSGLSV